MSDGSENIDRFVGTVTDAWRATGTHIRVPIWEARAAVREIARLREELASLKAATGHRPA